MKGFNFVEIENMLHVDVLMKNVNLRVLNKSINT